MDRTKELTDLILASVQEHTKEGDGQPAKPLPKFYIHDIKDEYTQEAYRIVLWP